MDWFKSRLIKFGIVPAWFVLFLFSSANAQNNKQLVVINTKNTTQVIRIEHGNVDRLYYGSKLENTSDYLKYNGGATGSLFPAFSGRTTEEAPLRAGHSNGLLSTEMGLVSFSGEKTDSNSELFRFELKDKSLPFFATIFIKTYYNEDVIEMWSEFRNEEAGNVQLHNFASAYLPLLAENYFLTSFYGTWFGEMKMQEQKLDQGIVTLQSIQGIRTTHNFNPSFMVSLNRPATEDEGEVIGGCVGWSGSWKLSFEKDALERLNIVAGINNYASTMILEPGKSRTGCRVFYSYSAKGKGQLSRNFHSWARKNALRGGDEIRPVVLNSWEGNYFDFDENKITTMIRNGAEMGIEMFVLDDGWFGSKKYQRDSDNKALGDWDVSGKRFPRGLESVIEEAKKHKIGMGIWVEPEMVNEKSELFEKHPEWALQEKGRDFHPERNQYVLDLSNPEVADYVYNSIHNILARYPYISYVKWDANSPVTNPGSTYLPKEEQESLWIKYIDNLYSVCEKLKKNHPGVLLQVCASGGGRVDYGSLPYFHEFWASDNTDALQRVFIQYGTSYFYPAIAMAAHVTKSPNGITQRHTPLKYRFDVAMSGRMGLELLPHDLIGDELVFAKEAVSTYKTIRPIVQFGDLYRLSSPYESPLASLMYATSDQSKAVVFVYQTQRMFGDYYPNLRLKGLDSAKRYRVTEINLMGNPQQPAGDEAIYTGEFLMKNGLFFSYWGKNGPLSVNAMNEFGSSVFLIENIL